MSATHSLVRAIGGELAVNEVRGRALPAVALGGDHEAAPAADTAQPRHLHQPCDPLLADTRSLVAQVGMNVGAAVVLVGCGMEQPDALGEHRVLRRTLRWCAHLPRVVAAGRDVEHAAHALHGKFGLVRAHELEDGVNVLSPLPANQAVAFERISLSILSCRFSRCHRRTNTPQFRRLNIPQFDE